MKTKKLLIVLTVFFSVSVYAEFVPVESAKKVALNFYFEKYNRFEGTVLYDQLKVRTVYTETDGINNFYYVFQINNKGFVIVPADDCLPPVLGYSFKHGFVAENQPDNVQYWFGQYKDQVLYARKNQIKPEKEMVDKWEYYINYNVEPVNNFTKNSEVEPLITTLWDQSFPFNLYCPANTLAGCQAPALAQIAYYWRWPDHGQGNTAYIPASHPEYGLQTADYENTWYRYNDMVDDPGNSNLAIAEYIYHFSAVFHTNFSTEISYVDSIFILNPQLACDSIAYHFKFDALQFYYRDSMPEIEWKGLLTGMLDTKCPIFYAGYSQYPIIGHFFVCDGYQDEDYFHFNFGWSGSFDGYYTLDNILSLNSNQFCLSSIHPDTAQFNYPFYASGADTLNALEGSITDGSGPVNDYLNNTTASWLIDPQTEHDSVTNITIMVKRLDLFDDGDKLRIYDGEDNSAPLLAELTGNVVPDDIVSTGNKLFVEFTTDASNTAPGFYLNYRTSQPDWCAGTTQITEQAATISDGSGSFYYDNGTTCGWIIDPGIEDSLTIYFNYFNTEEENDILKIVDGVTQETLAEISGNYEEPPGPVTSANGKMMLMFMTNNSVREQGWEVWYDINLGLTENRQDVNLQIIPNPASSNVKLIFSLKSAAKTSVEVIDIVGNKLLEIKDKALLPGKQSITVNMNNLSEGIYFCRLQIGNETITKKLIKIK